MQPWTNSRYKALDEKPFARTSRAALYKAKDPTGRLVAVKVYDVTGRDPAERAAFRRQFEKEIRNVQPLRSDFILKPEWYFEEPSADPTHYFLVLPWMDGGNLEDYLKNGAPPLEVAVKLADEIASALAEVHRHQIYHLDIKPANVLLTDGSSPMAKLADFNVSKDAAGSRLTHMLGYTPGYGSREQVAQGIAGKVDHRADLFAFGVLLYQLLTGRHPWGDTYESQWNVILTDQRPHQAPEVVCPALRQYPELVMLVNALLRHDPAHRPDSIEHALEVLAKMRPKAPWKNTRYQLLGELGDGGFGKVFRAHDSAVDVQVAIKQFAPQGVDEWAPFAARFRREAQVLASLDSPHVVRVKDYFEDAADSGRQACFMVMDLVRGADLKKRIQSNGDGLPVEEALRIGRDILQGLRKLHAQNPPVIHRDLKPANVLLTEPDVAAGELPTAKLIDFSLIVMQDQFVSVRGSGTAGYFPLEQCSYDRSGVGPWTDLFAFGVILYELLTGQKPFYFESWDGWVDVLQRGTQHIAPSTRRPELKNWPGLDELLSKLLAHDYRQRFQSAQQVLHAMKEIKEVPAVAESAAEAPAVQPPPAVLLDPTLGSYEMRFPTPRAAAPSRRPVLLWLTLAAMLLIALLWGGTTSMQHAATAAKALEGADPDYAAAIAELRRASRWNPFYRGRFAEVQKAYEFEVGESVSAACRSKRSAEAVRVLAIAAETLPESANEWQRLKQEYQTAGCPVGVDALVNPVDGLVYVRIPAGKFMMGCSPGDNQCEKDETQLEVTINKEFWIGQTEVTVGAWRRVVGTMPREIDFDGKNLNPGWRDESLPIVNVSVEDASNYCTKLQQGRLPSEKEWEYAARAGTVGPHYGDLASIAWFSDNSGDRRIDSAKLLGENSGDYAKRLTDNGNRMRPVATLAPNPWGLYDMLGNVWEWTSDFYDQSKARRVLRGGSWDSTPYGLRVSVRNYRDPTFRYFIAGFRCVWVWDPFAP